MCRLKILVVGLLVSGGPGICQTMGRVQTQVYPGKDWDRKGPVEVGLDERKLRAISEYSGGFGCVVRHGFMVYTWGDVSRRMDVASAAKPVYAHFLFKAVENGKIAGVDERIQELEAGKK